MENRLNQFINQYTGIPNVGDTPQNKGQCVGLIEVWTDSLNLPHTWGNAKDLLADADPNAFDIVYNDPNNTSQFPVAGDVICWDATWGGGDGHTGVIISANGTSFTAFEQNNPGGSAPHQVYHPNYNGVLGWLHPKVAITPPAPTPPQLTLNDQTKYDFGGSIGVQELGAVRSIINDTKNQLASQNDLLNKLNLQVTNLTVDNLALQKSLKTASNPPSVALPPTVDPAFSNSIAAFLYGLIKPYRVIKVD